MKISITTVTRQTIKEVPKEKTPAPELPCACLAALPIELTGIEIKLGI
jgi:hypothetical protein